MNSNYPTKNRYMPEARFVASRIVTALRDCNRNPVFREFILTERNGHVVLFAVLDEVRLGAPISGYATDEVLHQISTLTRGRRVAFSNSNGARYAILLSKPPKLPKLCHFPDEISADQFSLGVNRMGPIETPAHRLHNILIAGASRSGKSNFLTGLAYTGLQHGYALYLADPQEATFSPEIWNDICAEPVASSKADFMHLVETVHREMIERGNRFRDVTKPGGLPVQKLDEYNQWASQPIPRAFVIVDEANTYMDQRGVVDVLADLARQSLKYGIHLIIAAHSWRERDVPRSLSAQFATRLTFGVNDSTSAAVVMDSPVLGRRAMEISSPGRGILRLDGQKPQEFQAYLMPEDRIAQYRNDAPVQMRSPLSNEELDLVLLALDENRPQNEQGRMSASDLIGWGLKSKSARRLGTQWEYRGWLAKGANNARFVTKSLREIVQEIQR